MAVACNADRQIPTAEVYLSDGHAQEAIAKHRPELELALRALLSSCSVNTSAWVGTSDNWRTAATAPAIIANYATPVRVATIDEEIEVDSILFPLASLDHIFARRGETVFAFAKWNPELEAKLVCAPYLDLKRYARIREFCDVMGAS